MFCFSRNRSMWGSDAQAILSKGRLLLIASLLLLSDSLLAQGGGSEPPILGTANGPWVEPIVEMGSEVPVSSVELQSTEVPATTGRAYLLLAPAFVRYEQDDVEWSLTGSWSATTLNRASGGSFARSLTGGDTAQLTFDGSWIQLGFISDRFSGEVEVLIDGMSQGIFDLYRREETPTSFRFDGLSAGLHTIELVVTGSANPQASNVRVQLDYADTGDGSALPNGDFEETDPRLLISNGWSTTNYAGASGGTYLRSGSGTAWFPFSGDSFSLHALAFGSTGRVKLYVDGVALD
ncbi:MAG: hypothetical protein AAGJ52_15010, partial [Pseudomonadota bacterium]